MKLSRTFLTLSVPAALAFAACSTVEEAREAQKPENRLQGERTVAFSEFGYADGMTLSLSDLENIALVANPQIFQARQQVVSARLAVQDVRADYLPTVDGEASYTRQTRNETSSGSFRS